MRKRHLIISIFLFAYTIVLAHSIVPHHHHDDHKLEQSSDHHHNDFDHQDNDSDEGLAHEFGNYMHSVNSSDVYQQPDTQIDQIDITSIYLFTSFHFKFRLPESSPLIITLSNDCIPLIQHCLSSKGLRAPPLSLI